MKIADFQNVFRETQKKLPINDDALTKNYHSVEKLEDFLKNFAKQKSKEEKKKLWSYLLLYFFKIVRPD